MFIIIVIIFIFILKVVCLYLAVRPTSVLHIGTSEYQDIALLDTKRFGKVGLSLLIKFRFF